MESVMFDEKTKETLQGLSEDDAPLSVLPPPVSDDGDITTDDDDEGITRPMDAPISLPSVKKAKDFIRDHPEASLDVVFPTVYEEDRSAKLRDLETVQGLGYISKRRAANQAANELGFEEYDFDTEQEHIKREQPPMPQMIGAGDGMSGARMPQPSAPFGGQHAQIPQPPNPMMPNPDAMMHRADLSSPEQADFRRTQGYSDSRQSEESDEELESMREEIKGLTAVVHRLVESLARMEGRRIAESAARPPAPAQPINVEVHPPDVRVEAPRVEVHQPDINVEAAHVTVHPPDVNVEVKSLPPEHARMTRTYERDERGLIVRAIDTPEQGAPIILQVERDESGKITGVKPQ